MYHRNLGARRCGRLWQFRQSPRLSGGDCSDRKATLAESIRVTGLGDVAGVSVSLHLETPPDAEQPDRLAVELRIPCQVIRELAVPDCGYDADPSAWPVSRPVFENTPRRQAMDCESAREPTDGHKPGELLKAIAQELGNRGLEIREYRHGDELVELIIINPQDETRGRFSVGYDGKVAWEHRGDIETRTGIDKIRETIVRLLTSEDRSAC